MSDKDKSVRSANSTVSARKRGANKTFNFAIKQNDTAYVPGSTKARGRHNQFSPSKKFRHGGSKDKSPKGALKGNVMEASLQMA